MVLNIKIKILFFSLQALKMIKNIQSEMESQIENSNWLDEESKKIAKDKLNNMDIFVGFPEWYKNKTAVMNYYKGVRSY